jgi:hypothetical protein
MTAPSWRPCSMGFASRDRVGVGGRAPVRSGSLPTKATAIPAVVGCCASGRSRTRSPSGAPNERNAQLSQAAPWASTRPVYARRNVVERCINRLKQWRGLATRHEKRAVNYQAMVILASIVIWLKS